MKKLIQTTFLTMILCFGQNLFANNIEVNNITLENLTEAQQWVQVEFDLSWENSWRISVGPANYDAAWVIVKYRANGGDWQHAQLSTSDAVAAPGSTIDVAPDNTGAMIYRDANGSGDVQFTDLRLRWDYGGSVSVTDIIDVQVFAMEMVYVPEGAFWLGSNGGSENGRFHAGGDVNQPYQVTSETPITIGNASGQLYYLPFAQSGDQLGSLAADYPKGFGAFYCLKYEVTQAQWVNFFNTLTNTQKVLLDITNADESGKNSDAELLRNGVSWLDSGNATTNLPNVPITYVSTRRMNAFFDWAGLRPMTELEYVKACRGPLNPVNGEYAWGSTTLSTNVFTYANLDTESESITNIGEDIGNAIYLSTNGTPSGPKRNGILAASSLNHTREETGGTYFGIMEMSGNVYERMITVGRPIGRAFNGNHGDGSLLPTGNADVPNWPDPTTHEGYGYFGGGYPNSPTILRISDRNDAANSFNGSNGRVGIRGARSAF